MKFIYPTGQYEKITHKDKPNGYAGLDSTGLLHTEEIPLSYIEDNIKPIISMYKFLVR